MLSLTPPVPPPALPSLTPSNLSHTPTFKLTTSFFYLYLLHMCVHVFCVCVQKYINRTYCVVGIFFGPSTSPRNKDMETYY